MKAFAVVALLTLGGCGFHPLYAPAAPATAALGTVFVDIIPNRNGQLLRQALQARLEGSGSAAAKKYTLSVVLLQTGEALATQQNNFSSRERDTATALWSLREVGATGTQPITQGTARAVDGHDVLDAQFFYSDLQSDAATRRLAELVADQITQALAIYFREHPQRA